MEDLMNYNKILFNATKELTKLHLKLVNDFENVKSKTISTIKRAVEEAQKEAEKKQTKNSGKSRNKR
jgi:hypothetical protein